MGAIDRSRATPDPGSDTIGHANPGPPAGWEFPVPFGRGSATETMTGIAAPLLAGFSLALMGVVAQDPSNFLLPGAALFSLTATTILMVTCVQLGFRARSFLYSAADISAWWPEPRPVIVTAALQAQQAGHFQKWLSSSERARLAYNAAVVTLALSVALVLAPPGSASEGAVSMVDFGIRWAACALAGLAGLGELAWAVHDRLRARPQGTERMEETNVSSTESAADEQPDDRDATTSASSDEPDDEAQEFGVEVLSVFPPTTTTCRHSFDPQYCPFGCT